MLPALDQVLDGQINVCQPQIQITGPDLPISSHTVYFPPYRVGGLPRDPECGVQSLDALYLSSFSGAPPSLTETCALLAVWAGPLVYDSDTLHL